MFVPCKLLMAIRSGRSRLSLASRGAWLNVDCPIVFVPVWPVSAVLFSSVELTWSSSANIDGKVTGCAWGSESPPVTISAGGSRGGTAGARTLPLGVAWARAAKGAAGTSVPRKTASLSSKGGRATRSETSASFRDGAARSQRSALEPFRSVSFAPVLYWSKSSRPTGRLESDGYEIDPDRLGDRGRGSTSPWE